MANNSGLSKRAALRQQQEMEERKKRQTRIVGATLGAIGLVVVVVLAIVIFQQIGKNQAQTANQQTPPNATADAGIKLASDATPAEDVPHVVVYEDFQCPACAAREESYGPAFEALVDEGLITMEFRFATFMEGRMLNDSSTRPAIAASAADAVGKFREFHSLTFANQSESGAGYSDQLLRVDIPAAIGIEGDDLVKYQELYDTKAFADFVEDSNKAFENSKASATPSYMIGDDQLAFFDQGTQQVLIQPTPDDVMRAINELVG